jgi:sugar/nucleoside kinase (ribokinase family)
MIHVVGNSVLDIPLRYAPQWSNDTADAWTTQNVHFLQNPVGGVLGGCGAATAYVLGKLGQAVSLNTQLGDDPFGQVIRAWLDDAGVEVVGSSAEYTAVNVIPLGEDGSRRSLYYTGSKIGWDVSRSVVCDIFFASGYGLVDASDISVLTQVFQHMQAQGRKVVFDPGPWFMMRSDEKEMYQAWASVDVLVGTQDELNTWAQVDDVAGLCYTLRDLGPQCVVVKQGADGASFCGGEGLVEHVATKRVQQAYTVGAGDTFNAGLLYGLGKGDDLKQSVECAVDLATKAVQSGRGALGAFD